MTKEHVVEIAPYGDVDHNAVVKLVLDIQQQEFGANATYEGQADLRDPGDFFRSRGGEIWVARVGDEIVGTVAIIDFGGRCGALRKMFVRADMRGSRLGIADRLLDNLLDWARHRNMTAIYLDTSDAFRAAHRFYEKQGFNRVEMKDLPADFPAMSGAARFYRLLL